MGAFTISFDATSRSDALDIAVNLHHVKRKGQCYVHFNTMDWTIYDLLKKARDLDYVTLTNNNANIEISKILEETKPVLEKLDALEEKIAEYRQRLSSRVTPRYRLHEVCIILPLFAALFFCVGLVAGPGDLVTLVAGLGTVISITWLMLVYIGNLKSTDLAKINRKMHELDLLILSVKLEHHDLFIDEKTLPDVIQEAFFNLDEININVLKTMLKIEDDTLRAFLDKARCEYSVKIRGKIIKLEGTDIEGFTNLVQLSIRSTYYEHEYPTSHPSLATDENPANHKLVHHEIENQEQYSEKVTTILRKLQIISRENEDQCIILKHDKEKKQDLKIYLALTFGVEFAIAFAVGTIIYTSDLGIRFMGNLIASKTQVYTDAALYFLIVSVITFLILYFFMKTKTAITILNNEINNLNANNSLIKKSLQFIKRTKQHSKSIPIDFHVLELALQDISRLEIQILKEFLGTDDLENASFIDKCKIDFNLRIEGDYLVLENGDKNGFIARLREQLLNNKDLNAGLRFVAIA